MNPDNQKVKTFSNRESGFSRKRAYNQAYRQAYSDVDKDTSSRFSETRSGKRRKLITDEIDFLEATAQKFVAVLPRKYNSTLQLNLQLNLQLRGKVDTIDQNTNCHYVRLNIPFPEDYPKPSRVAEFSKIKKSGLFTATFALCDICPWKEYFKKSNALLTDKKHQCMLITQFYINPKLYDLTLNTIDKEILNGLGKTALCIGVNYFAKSGFINPENTLVMLDASGGSSDRPEDIERINELLKNEQELHRIFKQNYPKWYNSEGDQYTLEQLAEEYVAFENNKTLVNYYVKTFGFKIIDAETEPLGVLMATPLTSFIERCKF